MKMFSKFRYFLLFAVVNFTFWVTLAWIYFGKHYVGEDPPRYIPGAPIYINYGFWFYYFPIFVYFVIYWWNFIYNRPKPINKANTVKLNK